MKLKRLFIFIYAILISIALVGCCTQQNTSEAETLSFECKSESEVYAENEIKSEAEIEVKDETEVKTEAEVETEVEVKRKTDIKASVVVKFSEKEIIVFSDTSCFFDLQVSIHDGEFISENVYREFQISEGETIALTIQDLAPGFFSDTATIDTAYSLTPYVYGDSTLDEDNYQYIDCSLLIKCSSKEVIVYSDTTCFFDLLLFTEDDTFKSINKYYRLAISENETITLTLEDLAPGFFSDATQITSYSSYVTQYIQR